MSRRSTSRPWPCCLQAGRRKPLSWPTSIGTRVWWALWASRIAEEFACPTFLICLDGEHGKASSRSHGGFNLFASLTALSSLLESYGGHELAAGFTISRQNIPEFRRQMCALAAGYYTDDAPRTSLNLDCAIPAGASDIVQRGFPSGSGALRQQLPQAGADDAPADPGADFPVGGGRHMRLRLRSGRTLSTPSTSPPQSRPLPLPPGMWWTWPLPPRSTTTGENAPCR